MDFVSRAGSFIDRAHRLAGVLLLVVIVQSLIIINMWMSNADMANQVRYMSARLPVYVVPGATRGIYSPTEDDLLIKAFVDQVTQSFKTFTYETLAAQYQEMKQFFTPQMLADADSYFAKMLRDSQADRRSSLFIPDQQSMQVEKFTENGVDMRTVKIRGSLQTIIAGSVVESLPMEVTLKLQKTIISKANPFGFQLAQYNERALSSNPAQSVRPQ
ncbi:MAG: hypothetical protein H6922_05720 [Pseudomonadaceae bacterium]|nr:hypothetical protein [Pseudomonadaceae bacterium]